MRYYIRESRMSNVISISPSSTIEPWSRLWLPESSWDQNRSVDDDFLPIWADSDGTPVIDRSLPGIAPLAAFNETPFLLLLGRPGSGKSRELRDAHDKGWLGENSIWMEAKEMAGMHPGQFIASLLPSSESKPGLRLLIDGLDEALLQNTAFVAQLRGWLRRQLNSDGSLKFSLAISSRWSDWPVAQIQELASLWPKEASQKLILCPLRRMDVTQTLMQRYGEAGANEFWRQMHERHLVSVACWPQGLLGLMTGFEASGKKHLAASHGDAIREEVLRHCRLTDSPDDTQRWEASVAGCEWRQRVAGRVAAAMIWSGKASLTLQSVPHANALTVDDLTHTDELSEGARRSIKLSDLDDLVHRTGLMRRLSGSVCWVFQSQVHQEWLAADWLASKGLPTQKWRMLFGSESDGKWRVFPVLRSVAAWLARRDESFRSLVLSHDPLVLLRLDAASLPHAERKEIIEALLTATSDACVVDPGVWQAHLPSLVHPEIADQLGGWLGRSDIHVPARELAVEIAEKARISALAPLLWQLYPQTNDRLQIEIASALYRVGREGFDEEWQAVLRGELPLDSHGTMLGAALEIMVIDSAKLPMRDVLRWIVPKYPFDVFGLYEMASRKVHEKLTVADLPAVFAKLAENPDFIHDSLSNAHELNKAALKLAVEHFDQPEVARALVEYWHACTARHRHPHHELNEAWEPEKSAFSDPVRRRQIARRLIHHPGFETNTKREWAWAGDWLVAPEDFDWCLDELLAAAEPEEWRYAILIRNLVREVDLNGPLGNKLNAAANKSAFLRSQLPETQPDESVTEAIFREAAKQSAKHQREHEKSAGRYAQKRDAYAKRIRSYEDAYAKAHQEGAIVWPGVVRVLGAREHGLGSYTVEFGPEQKIGEQEAWMREAARRYLLQAPDHGGDEDIDALFAISVCVDDLNSPSPVHDVVATHWLPIFITTLSSSGLGEPPEGLSLKRFAELFPAEFARAFGQVMRRRYLGKSSLGELRQFQEYWTAAMSLEIIEMLTQEPIQPEGFPDAFCALATASESDAIQVGSHWLEKMDQIEPTSAKAALLGACTVRTNGRMAAEVRPHLGDHALVREAVFFATKTLHSITAHMDFTPWPDHAVKELADNVWQAFPQIKRRHSNSAGARLGGVSGTDYAIEFRESITSAACDRGLEVTIPVVHPEDSLEQAADRQRTLNWNRHMASQARAGSAWQPLAPRSFFQLASRPNARLARNADELMEAVIECLQRWEQRLRAGDWDQLWDHKTSRPEERIAQKMRDWLKAELDILVEREVELTDESRTDILVQTTTAISPLSVVIELKKLRKSNAKERRIAMKTQLLDRYLKPRLSEGWTHGLYVIAWTAEPGSRDDNVNALSKAADSLAAQAIQLSQPPFTLTSLVLDTRFSPQSS